MYHCVKNGDNYDYGKYADNKLFHGTPPLSDTYTVKVSLWRRIADLA
jgi:hypothetical protein